MKKIFFTLLAAGFLLAGYAQQNPAFRGKTPTSFQSATPVNHSFQQKSWSPSTKIGSTPISGITSSPCVDTLLFEDFQSQSIPVSWINNDLDGLTDANGRPQNWFTTQDAQTTSPGDTNYVAAASSWFTLPGAANNWLILDSISPCSTTVLSWWSAPFEGPAYMDGYKVLVSMTGTNLVDFTDTIFVAAEDISAGAGTAGPGNVHTNWNGSNGVLQNWQTSLGAYDGQTIYIAFVHDSYDDNLLMLDNIFVGVIAQYDLAVDSINIGTDYAITPLSQVQPMTYSARISLIGSAAVTSPTLGVEVLNGGTSVFTANPTMATLAGNSSATFTTGTYSPTATGAYAVTYNASALETDPNLSNNTDTAYFFVSDTTYSRADSTTDGALSIGAGASGFLGNAYEIVTAGDLTSISFFVTAATIGDTVYAAVYNMVGGVPSTMIGSSSPMLYSDSAASWYTLPLSGGPLNLTPGTYVVGLHESTSGTLRLGTNTTAFVPGVAWVFFNGSWANNEDFNFQNVNNITANFGVACTAPVAAFTETSAGLSTAFTDGSTSSGTIGSWLWDFGDGNTSTMQNPSHTYATGGTYTVCLIVTNACGSDTTCQSLSVSCTAPVAAFTEISAGLSTAFTDGSTSSATISSWFWDFGDGNTSTMQNPSHTYAAGGTYTVCLTVSDVCGADSSCQSLSVACTAPLAAFADSTSGLSAVFTDGSTSASTIDSWLWDFGDGNTSTLQNPNHTYAAAGTYTVCLTVTDACGADSSCQSLSITGGVGLEDPRIAQMAIYPIPATEQLTVDHINIRSPYQIALFNSMGQLVLTKSFPGDSQIQLNVADLPAGFYSLRITAEGISGARSILIRE